MTPKTSLPTLVTTLLLASLTLTPTPTLAAGDVTAVACPNEALVGFSPVLSECRGLEMVTPPYEAGEEPGVKAVSANGSHVVDESLGGYSGAENSSYPGTAYLAGRGAAGWGSAVLNSPSSAFPAQEYLTASSDLSRSLWRFRSASEPITGEDLYLKEADGSLIKIGSLVPPVDQQGPAAGDDIHFYSQTKIEFQEASTDLSHIIFDIKKAGPLWPSDTTIADVSNHSSLYEYEGAGKMQPTLVGVSDGKSFLKGFKSNPSNPGEPVEDDEVLPAGSLISDCQTHLGSEHEDGYNAMSADGDAVFFTAAGVEGTRGPDECQGELVNGTHLAALPHAPAVNELYARLDGSQTVPISEPSATQCVSCQQGEQERAAEFAGASEDGSKAFFITEQELFPGDIGENLYEYDFDAPQGEHLIPVSGNASVLGVARVSEDGSHTYFVAEGDLTGIQQNAVGREAIAGQPNLYVFIQNAAHPTGEVVFITTLSSEDRHDWAKDDHDREVQATPDGRFVVFASYLNVASPSALTEGSRQVFEYDAENGELVRVSTGQAGFAEGTEDANNSGAETPYQSYQTSSDLLGPTRAGTGLAVSADGSTVVFSSQGALTESALREDGEVPALSSPSETNIYEFHSPTALSGGEVHMAAARAESLEGLDASGGNVFFRTRRQLVPTDVDGALNLYDARIDGGVPVTPTVAECAGEGCLGAREAAPLLPGVGGSALANGVTPTPAASPVVSVPTPKAGPKALTKTQKLSRALRACRKKSKKDRAACEKRARRTYGRTR
jgi:hypothetical protein